MENVEAIAAVVGLVNGFRLLEAKDKKGFYYFAGAVVVGIIFGAFKWFGVEGIEQGLVVALASSGLYRVGQVVAGK